MARAVQTYGLPRHVEPHTALFEELARATGVVDYLEQLVRELTAEELTWSVSEHRTERGGEGSERTVTVRKAQVNALIELYDRERARKVDVAATIQRSGAYEARARLDTRTADLFVLAMDRLFTELGMMDDPRLDEAVPRILRAVGSGEVGSGEEETSPRALGPGAA